MKWNVGAKIGMGYALALSILLMIGVVSYQSIVGLNKDAEVVNFTYEEIKDTTQVMLDLANMQAGTRGYAIAGLDNFLDYYNESLRNIDVELARVREMMKENSSLTAKLDKLDIMIAEVTVIYDEIINIRRLGDIEKAQEQITSERGKEIMDEIRLTIDEMQIELAGLLEERSLVTERSSRRTEDIIVFGIPIAFLILSLASFVITRSITKPLKGTIVLANQISEGDLSMGMPNQKRRDEIGSLERAFYTMTESLSYSASIADQIASGDLSVSVNPKSEKDVMGNALYSMVESLKQMASVADQIASGNLSVIVKPKSEKDVMGNALEKMVTSLQGITREIIDGVNVIASASSEIMASTAQVASGASETAAAVIQTTSSVEEVKQGTLLASEKVKIVADATQSTVNISEVGIRAVEKSVSGMMDIQNQVESVAQSLIRLSEQSQTIGEIITSVNDLAEQSNLLAVNAAIEAAKAGEQGKGFAVVAQEVKILAVQSKEATAQVRTILSDIMKATTSAVMATEQGSKAVELGVTQSKEAGETIRQMVKHIENAAQSAMQIAVTSQQQLTGMNQVAMAMENIKQASEQNVVGTKQVESTVRNLHDLGKRLKHTVELFKISS